MTTARTSAPAARRPWLSGPGPTGRRRTRPSAVSLVLCAVLGTGVGVALAADGTGPVRTTPAAAPAGPPPCQLDCGPDQSRADGPLPTGPPTRVRIPRIRVDSTLARLRVDRTGRPGAPTDFGSAGWYADGTVPGDVGPAVLAGHVDSETGPAVFYRLSELQPGDRIEVRRGAEWLPFRVTGTNRYAKDEFPTAAVYGPTPGPELRLITCAGVFDRPTRHYRDNLVVFAVADRPVVMPNSAAG